MEPLKFSKRIDLPDLPPSPQTLNNVRAHLKLSVIWSLVGFIAVLGVPLIAGREGILALVIALPPAILCGNAWVQILRKHPIWIEQKSSLRSLLSGARRQEPTLFWLGMVGAVLIGGLTYILAAIPVVGAAGLLFAGTAFVLEMLGLYLIMVGCAALPLLFHLRKRLRDFHNRERVTARLATLFIENYDYHKN